MNCPVCNYQLKQLTVSNIQLDACDGGCGGIWFDRFELAKFDEPHEQTGEALLNLKRSPKVAVDEQARIKCPKCPDAILMRNFFSVKRQVKVDVCPSCAGTWIDVGELGTIRSEFLTEAERAKAAETCFNEMFKDPLAELRNPSAGEREKVKRVVNLFRFICPSYYMEGKQPWGAF